ncbi:MAG: universal stress protein [Acidimicrobiales bacterium]
MTVILAAIDNSGAALPVLRAAATMARTLQAEARAVHVREGTDIDAAAMGLHVGMSIEAIDGDPIDRIVEASANADVDLVVIGARRHVAGRRTFGHVARAIMTQVHKPVLVVPPDSLLPGANRFQRVLVPLEGSVDSADAVAEQLRTLTEAGAAITVVHVFHPGTLPRFWDQAGHAHQSWASEFLTHWCAQPAVELLLRSGDVAAAILDVAAEEAIDLIVLGWSQNITGDRARVVRDLLSRSEVPVLLTPVTR